MGNFWDSIKPAAKVAVAVKVELLEDQRTLRLRWDDGVLTTVTAQALRRSCPCAECVEEWTGKRTFDPAKISSELKLLEISEVGNYALTFTFSDLHKIGIFTWKGLRELSSVSGDG